MKFKSLIFTLVPIIFFFNSIVEAKETYSDSISDFYGVKNLPLLPGDYNFVYADEITRDGYFTPVENFQNSRPNISIQGEIRTGNVETFSSDQNSISLSFAVLQEDSVETDLRKTFYACNVVRDVTELVTSNIEVFDDYQFVEYCSFIFQNLIQFLLIIITAQMTALSCNITFSYQILRILAKKLLAN
jgi:hypothetical protein